MSLKIVNTPDGRHYFANAETEERVDVTLAGEPGEPGSLKNFGRFILFIGWILLVVSITALIAGAIVKSDSGIYRVIGGAVVLLNAILVVALGRLMTSVASIEETTHKNNKMLEELLKKLQLP